MMQQTMQAAQSSRYAKTIEASKRIRWDIDRDVIRGREFDFSKKFLPDGLSRADRLEFLGADQKRFLSQIQGRKSFNADREAVCRFVREVNERGLVEQCKEFSGADLHTGSHFNREDERLQQDDAFVLQAGRGRAGRKLSPSPLCGASS